jgi:3-deoxy-7-phosphoheptulonate synthase
LKKQLQFSIIKNLHRNLVDFSHDPGCEETDQAPCMYCDPTHSVGSKDRAPDGLLDIFHATAQGVIVGANMILVECHPRPEVALCDGPQALTMQEIDHFVADVEIVRRAYEERKALAEKY